MIIGKNIQYSWQSGNEVSDNEYFWLQFGFNDEEVRKYNTDGIIDGCLFEFKNTISNLNNVLFQSIQYLSKLRNKGGIPIPSVIALVDISRDTVYVYNSNKYIEYISKDYSYSASRNTETITLPNNTNPEKIVEFDVRNPKNPKNKELLKLFKIKKYEKFNVKYPNIIGWANYIYDYDNKITKSKMFEILKNPENTFMNDYILNLIGNENDFDNIMDILNDRLNKKDLGAFYTPKLYVEEAMKLVREAIKKVPKNKDYIILDRCAGTGNLEEFFTEEELSHIVLNTFEIKEWLVLYQKFSNKVRGIIPPFENVLTQKGNLVDGGDALSEIFLDTIIETNHKIKTLREYINDKNTVIIGFENPPYSDENARNQDGLKKEKKDFSFIRKEMVKDKNINGNDAKDLANQFIWSFEKYFMRSKDDAYIVFSPIKYWKSANLMNKKFLGGFIANKGNFKATESAVAVCYWDSENDNITQNINLKVLEIQLDGKKYKTGKGTDAISIPDKAYLKYIKNIEIKKVYKTLKELYSPKSKDDITSEIALGYDGYETEKYKNKKYGNVVYNKNIIGVLEASGFGLTQQDVRLVRIAIYHGFGSQIRYSNYHEQLPLFVAKNFIKEDWYEDGVYYSTADDINKNYLKDSDFLRKCIIWSCITPKNHCRSFLGSDNIFYKNELCFDEKSKIYEDITLNTFGEIDFDDKMLIGVFMELLKLCKETDEYKEKIKVFPEFTFGTYQIEKEINNQYIDNNGKKIYSYPKINTKISELKKRLNEYFNSQLREKLFKYELIK